MKPSDDPRADELRNKNLSAPSQKTEEAPSEPNNEEDEVIEESRKASGLDEKISKRKSTK